MHATAEPHPHRTLAAVLMSVSTIVVAVNAQRLRRVELRPAVLTAGEL
jgi:cation transport ATPase